MATRDDATQSDAISVRSHARASDSVLELDRDLRIVAAGLGYPHPFQHAGELLGKSFAELVDWADRERVRLAIESAFEERAPTPLRFRTSGGDSVDAVAIVLTGGAAPLAESRCILTIASHRVDGSGPEGPRLDRPADRLEVIVRRFLELGGDELERGIASAVEDAGRLADADAARLFVAGHEGSGISPYEFRWTASDIGSPFPDESIASRISLVGKYRYFVECVMSGAILHVPDVSGLPPEASLEKAELEASGVAAYLVVPIVMNEATVGFLDFRRMRAPRGWTEAELSRLQLIADVIGSVLRRRQSDVARRAFEGRFRTLAENAQDAICEIDEQGEVTYLSPSARRMLAHVPSRIGPRVMRELMHPDDFPAVECFFRAAFAGRVRDPIVFRVRNREGEYWAVEASAGTTYENVDGAKSLVLIVRDVGDREREREKLERRLEYEALVSHLSRTLLADGVGQDGASIQNALAMVAKVSAADRCLMVSVDDLSLGRPAAFEWRSHDYLPDSPHIRVEDFARFEWCGARLNEGREVRVEDVREMPEAAAEESAFIRRTDVRSFIALPTRVGGLLSTVLILQFADVHEPWDDDEVRLLRMLSELFTSALRRKRADDALRQSEARFRGLAESARDSICEIGADGTMHYASPSFAHLLGFQPEELHERRIFDLLHSEDRREIEARFDVFLRDEASDVWTCRARHREGDILHLEVSTSPIEAGTGERRLAAVIRDVTEREISRRHLEEQLSLEKQVAGLSREFVALDGPAIGEGVQSALRLVADLARADRSWLLSFGDEPARDFERYEWMRDGIGVDPPEITVAPDLFPWSSRRLLSGEPMIVTDPESLPAEASHERADMLERGVRSMLGIPIMSGGRFLAFLGFESYQRRTEWSERETTLLGLVGEILLSALRRQQTSLELQKSQAQLLQAQKMEAVGTLAGGVAHDFNNHLAVMLGNARFVQRELDDDGDVAEALVDLERSAEHCAQLTRSLLAFSRRAPVSVGVIEVTSALSQVSELVGPLLPSAIELTVEVEPEIGGIAADPVQLQQVLVNLMVNARDSMPEGGVLGLCARRRRLLEPDAGRLGLPAADGYVEISVSDSGKGMEPEIVSRIFEPFFTTKAPGEGTGLGLATSYGIVQQFRGAIEVETELGVGSTFRVLLPNHVAGEASAEPQETQETRGAGEELIVLAEDEPALRRLIARQLESAGFRVLACASGDAVLAELADAERAPALLLTDLVMPGMGGLELATELRERWPSLPIIVSSGYADRETQDRADGIAGYFTLGKPFTAEELVALVARALASDDVDGESIGTGWTI